MDGLPYDHKGVMAANMHAQVACSEDPKAHGNTGSATQHISYLNQSNTTSSASFITNPSPAHFHFIPLCTEPLSALPSEEVTKEPRRFKLSRTQTVALEKLYQQTPKPNQNTKRELADAIDLSLTRVNVSV